MWHRRGDLHKVRNRARLIAEAMKSHNLWVAEKDDSTEVYWNSEEDIPEKSLHRILRNEGKSVWHCDPSRCSYCLMNRTHKNDVRDDAMQAEYEFWQAGGYEESPE